MLYRCSKESKDLRKNPNSSVYFQKTLDESNVSLSFFGLPMTPNTKNQKSRAVTKIMQTFEQLGITVPDQEDVIECLVQRLELTDVFDKKKPTKSGNEYFWHDKTLIQH